MVVSMDFRLTDRQRGTSTRGRGTVGWAAQPPESEGGNIRGMWSKSETPRISWMNRPLAYGGTTDGMTSVWRVLEALG